MGVGTRECTRDRNAILPVGPAIISGRPRRVADGQGRSFIAASGIGQDTGLKLVRRGEGLGQLRRQGIGQHQLVAGNADRCIDAAKCILDDDAVALAAQDQADAWIVVRLAVVIIQCREIEIHLAGVLRLERPRLQVDGDKAAQLAVVEEQVDVKNLARQPRDDAGCR